MRQERKAMKEESQKTKNNERKASEMKKQKRGALGI